MLRDRFPPSHPDTVRKKEDMLYWAPKKKKKKKKDPWKVTFYNRRMAMQQSLNSACLCNLIWIFTACWLLLHGFVDAPEISLLKKPTLKFVEQYHHSQMPKTILLTAESAEICKEYMHKYKNRIHFLIFFSLKVNAEIFAFNNFKYF